MAIGTLLQVLAVATVTSAAPWKRAPLEVQLEHLNNTSINAIITNTGKEALSFLHRNSILDPHPSRKLSVDAPFHGMHAHCSGSPSSDDFTVVAAGETLHRNIDVAELYDLSAGVHEISASGSLPYTSDGSFRLTGDSLPFSSNILQLAVGEAEAEELARAELVKRTTFGDDCSSEELASVQAATEDCANMASAAAEAATSGDAAFFEKYFMDSSESTRNHVAEVFQAVAKECSNTPGGQTTSHCSDGMNHCSANVLAYTYWSGYNQDEAGEVFYCPSYYSLPQDGTYCHAQTQGGNVLHEMTHAVAGTDDLGYGYDAIVQLSMDQALLNADTYSLYAEALQIGCNGGDSSGGSSSGSGGSGGSGSSPEPSGTAPAPTGSAPVPTYSAPVPTYSAPSPSGGAGWPIPNDEPTSSGSDGYTWPDSSSGDSSSGSTGGVTTWTWSSDGWSSSNGESVPTSSSSSSSSTQSWNDWFTALMNRYTATRSGSTDASMKTVSKIATDDSGREFGDGGNDDPRGFEHTQGWDEKGHWTD